jgi:phosphoadenosine phosphosulfate reductase
MNSPKGAMSLDAAILDRELRSADLDTFLARAVEVFRGARLGVVSAFGPGSLVVLDRLHALGLRLPVYFVDTLHHFPETLALVERARELYGLDLRIFRSFPSRGEFEAAHGPRLWERDLDLYQRVAKVEPFRRATAELDGWITGRRRDQAGSRADLPVVEGGDKLRLNPLASWSRSDVWKEILAHRIPYNPLHDRGYSSIGDEPLTTPVASGEPERAGRWRGNGRTECGIHLGES